MDAINESLKEKKSLEPDIIMLICSLHTTVKTEQLTEHDMLHVKVKVC